MKTKEQLYELTLKELFRLPYNWQVFVYNLQTKRYALGTAGNCSTLGASRQRFFVISLPQGFNGGI